MATATKTKNPYIGHGSAGNNDGARRAKTAKEGKCQWCHKKVPLSDQFVVFNDFETETTKKVKGADKPVHAKRSHYCDECASKRQKVKQAGDFKRRSGGGSTKRSSKRTAAKKAKPAAKAKAKSAAKPAARKRTVKRTVKRSKASSAKDPF